MLHWVISNGAVLGLAEVYVVKIESLFSFMVQVFFINIWLSIVILTIKIYFANEPEDKTDLIEDDDCCIKQKDHTVIKV